MKPVTLSLASVDSSSKILVCIDFGTTFSGVAWVQTARPDAIYTIDQWPDAEGNPEGTTKEKVPTRLSYTTDGKLLWGFEVGNTEAHFKEFKLGLSKRQATDSHVEKRYPDPYGMPPTHTYPATKLTADYIRELRNHTLKAIKLKLGNAVVDNTAVEYTFTVPAIWDEHAKAATIACAKAAGCEGPIGIVSEPEAAILYTIESLGEEVLKEGSTIIMCDAGGGTVDLISYLVVSLKPLIVKEIVVGDGNKCGSVYLNRIFCEKLKELISGLAGYFEDTLEAALEQFECYIKTSFDGKPDIVRVNVPGLDNNKAKGVVRNRFSMPGTTLRDIFEPVISVATALVQTQQKQTTGHVSAVLLVGGFGQNPYLRKTIQEVVGPEVQVIKPPNGWTAVVRGAALKALRSDVPDLSKLKIDTRKARKCYGSTVVVPFVAGKHQKKRRVYVDFHGYHMIEIVDWIVKKGDELKESEPKLLKYHQSWRTTDPSPFFYIDIFAFESETGREPPLYDDQGARRLATLHVDLSSIPTGRLTALRGADNYQHYRINVEVRVKFESAHIDYSLWYEGHCYGSVEAKYD